MVKDITATIDDDQLFILKSGDRIDKQHHSAIMSLRIGADCAAQLTPCETRIINQQTQNAAGARLFVPNHVMPLPANNIVLGEFTGYYAIPELYRHLWDFYHNLIVCQASSFSS